MNHQRLILLFGLPRSGTTWAGKIFDSHPDTLYRHEPDSWARLGEIPLAPDAAPVPDLEQRLAAFADRLPGLRTTKVAGSLPLFPKRRQSGLGFQLHRAGVLAAKAAARLTGEFPVPGWGLTARDESTRIVWKSIESVGRMGLVARSLPGSRGVLLVRHPCGFAASILRGERNRHFTSEVAASEDYGIFEALLTTGPARRRGLTLADLQLMQPEERLAWRWVLFNEKAMEDIADIDGFDVVRYEDLCRAPLAITRRMFEGCGLSMDPQTEAFLAQSSSENRESYYSVYKDPVHSASRWRQELAPEVVARILGITRGTPPGALFPEEPGSSDDSQGPAMGPTPFG
jgi:hypothetical protein